MKLWAKSKLHDICSIFYFIMLYKWLLKNCPKVKVSNTHNEIHLTTGHSKWLRGTDTPGYRPEKPAGTTHSSRSDLSPREQLERQAEFHSSTQDEAWLSCPNSAGTLRSESDLAHSKPGEEPWGSCLNLSWGPLPLHQTQWSSERPLPTPQWPWLLRGTLRTQGTNLGLLHCRQILYHLRHQGKCPDNAKLLPRLFVPLTPANSPTSPTLDIDHALEYLPIW